MHLEPFLSANAQKMPLPSSSTIVLTFMVNRTPYTRQKLTSTLDAMYSTLWHTTHEVYNRHLQTADATKIVNGMISNFLRYYCD